jgi:hypothetical protein
VTTVARRGGGQRGHGDDQGGGSVNPAPGVSTVCIKPFCQPRDAAQWEES